MSTGSLAFVATAVPDVTKLGYGQRPRPQVQRERATAAHVGDRRGDEGAGMRFGCELTPQCRPLSSQESWLLVAVPPRIVEAYGERRRFTPSAKVGGIDLTPGGRFADLGRPGGLGFNGVF